MKFCQFIAGLHPQTFTSFGQFIVLFSKMALIFLEGLIVFAISSFEFHKSNCHDFIANDDGPGLISTGLSGLGAMLESYHKLQPKPKTVPEFKDALQLIWSALPEKAIDSAVKDYCRHVCQPTLDILNI